LPLSAKPIPPEVTAPEVRSSVPPPVTVVLIAVPLERIAKPLLPTVVLIA
jgi:hypothetical protein